MAEVKKDETRFVIAIYVDNKFGVLTRVTSMFTRRGFNIDALTVGVTESPEYSRITISMSGDGYAKAQMLNQLRKLHNVKKVEILDEKDTIERELLLIKVKNTAAQLIPLAAATPMRTPVKEPGPSATATAVTSVMVLPHCFSRSSAMTIRVWLWVRPVFW